IPRTAIPFAPAGPGRVGTRSGGRAREPAGPDSTIRVGREQPPGLDDVGPHLGGELVGGGGGGPGAGGAADGARPGEVGGEAPPPRGAGGAAVEVEHVALAPPLGAELGVGADAD